MRTAAFGRSFFLDESGRAKLADMVTSTCPETGEQCHVSLQIDWVLCVLMRRRDPARPCGLAARGGLGSVAVTEADVENLFVAWNNALQTENPDRVVALYATDAIPLPMGENGPYTDHAAIRRYFVDFLKKKPGGAIDRPHNIRIGCNVAFDSGLYTFTYGKKPNDPTPARYTYVYRYVGGTWLIAHHHSSKQPN
jgi:uncharacterized protein (TIGR02246 family)